MTKKVTAAIGVLLLPWILHAQEPPAEWLLCTGEMGPPRSAPPPVRRSAGTTVSDLVDSLAVAEGVARFREEDPRDGCALFLLVLPRSGIPAYVADRYETDLPAAMLVQLQGLLNEAIRPAGPRPEAAPDPLVARLLVRSGPTPSIELGAAQSTPPEVLNRSQIERLLNESGLAQPFEQRVVLRFLVEADGIASQTVVSQSTAVLPVQEALLGIVEGLRFRPMRLDGVPVRAWVQVPFDIGAAPGG